MDFRAYVSDFLFHHVFPLYRSLYYLYKKLSDRQVKKIMGMIIRSGDIVLDIGANIGYYSETMAGLTGPEGRVFAFEPSLRNYHHLLNASKQLPQIRPLQAAVSDVTGTAYLYESANMNVDHRMYKTEEGQQVQEVHTIRLDDYFPDTTGISFVKIDVQGFELSVLKGMRELIARNQQMIILCEYWPYGLKQAGTDKDELLSLIKSFGLEYLLVGQHQSSSTVGTAIRKIDAGGSGSYGDLLLYHSSSTARIQSLFDS